MIRGGNGKLKGRRNRRPAKCPRYAWRRIKADRIVTRREFYISVLTVDTIQLSAIQDATKW